MSFEEIWLKINEVMSSLYDTSSQLFDDLQEVNSRHHNAAHKNGMHLDVQHTINEKCILCT